MTWGGSLNNYVSLIHSCNQLPLKLQYGPPLLIWTPRSIKINKKRKKRKMSHGKEFQIFCVSYSTAKKMEHTSPLLKCGLHIMTFFQRVQYRKGGGKDELHSKEP